ncbi:MAG: pyroglutamyl-peptidase I [Thermoplasmata archaeon]|nr:pyroglutamyl-peptidase I [Thermoplasmata archaeon]
MRRVLLTGFVPFGGHKVNPSEVAARDYRLTRLDDIVEEDLLLDQTVLPVDTSAPDILEDLLGPWTYDLVVHLGLHDRADRVRVERRATNVMDFRIPDNRGAQVKGRPVIEGGPEALPTTWPVDAIVSGLGSAGIPAEASDSAGSFLCNMLLYRSLHFHWQARRDAAVGLLHVPTLDVLPPDDLFRAVDVVLATCIRERPMGRSTGA